MISMSGRVDPRVTDGGARGTGLHAASHTAFLSQQALPPFAVSPADGCFNLDRYLYLLMQGLTALGLLI